MSSEISKIPVVLLCGGKGVYIDGSGERVLKPLVKVEGRPLILPLLESYIRAGFKKFVLSAGYQFKELESAISPLKSQAEIQVIDTGLETPTGGRITKVAAHLKGADHFAVTYGDTLSAIDLNKLLQFHLRHGKVASLIAVRMPTRFRVLGMRYGESQIRGFAEKSVIQNDVINGGFYFFRRELLSDRYLGHNPSVTLETEILEKLALNGQLQAFSFRGHWHYLDNERDLAKLSTVVEALKKPSAATNA